MRKLASIQIIQNLQPIERADRIEVATVLGWQVVVQRGLHQVGDQVVYLEVDSVLPSHPAFNGIIENWGARLKTVKLRGQVSQGLLIPAAELLDEELPIGTDVTEQLGVELYRHPAEDVPGSDIIGVLPGYIPRSQEPRIQAYPELVDEIQGTKCCITTKINGQSMTVLQDQGTTLIGSRRGAMRPGTKYWTAAQRYCLPGLVQRNPDLAIRGETAGPGIQGNQLGLDAVDFFCYDVYCISEARYFGFHELQEFCFQHKIQMVPPLGVNVAANWTIVELIRLARGVYSNGYPREGIVVRPMEEQHSEVLVSRLSFKVLNEQHLLKES